MSSIFQAVVRSPSFTGLGYFPDLTPARNDDRLMGIRAWMLVFLLPTICQTRKNPVSGSWLDVAVIGSALLILINKASINSYVFALTS